MIRKAQSDQDLDTVGRDQRKVDGLAKSTGRARYTDDLTLPGMLHAKILRSPHPHAIIKSIDTAKALAAPGVKAVITGDDLVNFPIETPVMVGPADLRFVSRNIMAREKVLYAGHAVAAVAATGVERISVGALTHSARVLDLSMDWSMDDRLSAQESPKSTGMGS